jgi:hypothetical protein
MRLCRRGPYLRTKTVKKRLMSLRRVENIQKLNSCDLTRNRATVSHAGTESYRGEQSALPRK